MLNKVMMISSNVLMWMNKNRKVEISSDNSYLILKFPHEYEEISALIFSTNLMVYKTITLKYSRLVLNF